MYDRDTTYPHGLHDRARAYIAADPSADIVDALRGRAPLPRNPTIEQWTVATVDRHYNSGWWSEEAKQWYSERLDPSQFGPRVIEQQERKQ